MHWEAVGYEISLQGHLDERWATRFDGMRVKNTFDQQGFPIAVLSGIIADQAALHGVIAKIRDLGIPVISISRIGSNPRREIRERRTTMTTRDTAVREKPDRQSERGTNARKGEAQ